MFAKLINLRVPECLKQAQGSTDHLDPSNEAWTPHQNECRQPSREKRQGGAGHILGRSEESSREWHATAERCVPAQQECEMPAMQPKEGQGCDRDRDPVPQLCHGAWRST